MTTEPLYFADLEADAEREQRQRRRLTDLENRVRSLEQQTRVLEQVLHQLASNGVIRPHEPGKTPVSVR